MQNSPLDKTLIAHRVESSTLKIKKFALMAYHYGTWHSIKCINRLLKILKLYVFGVEPLLWKKNYLFWAYLSHPFLKECRLNFSGSQIFSTEIFLE